MTPDQAANAPELALDSAVATELLSHGINAAHVAELDARIDAILNRFRAEQEEAHQAGIAAARAEVSAQLTVTGVKVDPATALLVCVQLAAGHVEFASRQVDLRIAAADDPEHVALGPWGRVQAEAMDRLARYSKMAIDAGATEIQLRYAEREGAAIGTVLRKVFDEIELTPEQKRIAPDILERHLKALEERLPTQKKD